MGHIPKERRGESSSQQHLDLIRAKARLPRTSVILILAARKAKESLSEAKANMPMLKVRANMPNAATKARAKVGSPMPSL